MQLTDLQRIASQLGAPFYQEVEFWISLVVSLVGVLFSLLAYGEARKAKLAAAEAGRTVKI